MFDHVHCTHLIIKNRMKIFEIKKHHFFEATKKRTTFLGHLVIFKYSLHLNFIIWSVSHMCKKS
jgi:hypothetical protein